MGSTLRVGNHDPDVGSFNHQQMTELSEIKELTGKYPQHYNQDSQEGTLYTREVLPELTSEPNSASHQRMRNSWSNSPRNHQPPIFGSGVQDHHSNNPYLGNRTDNSTMTLNGQSFNLKQRVHVPRIKSVQRHRKRVVPDMVVTCKTCGIQEKVLGTTSRYICYRCQNVNTCYPIYNVVRCKECKANICYMYNTSSRVKCVKCNQINDVPLVRDVDRLSRSNLSESKSHILSQKSHNHRQHRG